VLREWQTNPLLGTTGPPGTQTNPPRLQTSSRHLRNDLQARQTNPLLGQTRFFAKKRISHSGKRTFRAANELT